MKIHNSKLKDLLESKDFDKISKLNETFQIPAPAEENSGEEEETSNDAITEYGNYLYTRLKKKYSYFQNISENAKLYGPYFKGIEIKLYQQKDINNNFINCIYINVSFIKKSGAGNESVSMNLIPGSRENILNNSIGVPVDEDTEYKVYAILNILLGNKFRSYSKIIYSDQFNSFINDKLSSEITDDRSQNLFFRAIFSILIPEQYLSQNDLTLRNEFSKNTYQETIRFIESNIHSNLTFSN